METKEKECCHISASPCIFKKIWQDYKPLIIVLVYCILLSVISLPHLDFMNSFMGYFFIFFSLFKLFDLNGFASGFASYDLLAKKIKLYGYVYPFIELGLGISYLANFAPIFINYFTLILMIISSIGVINTIASGNKPKCACLGTILNVPLSTVTILENVGMGLMACYMLFKLTT